MIEYSKRLVEVDEILKYIPRSSSSKIPKEIQEIITANKDKDYIWKYDATLKLQEQKLSRDTIAILSYLNIEYMLNKEQKQLMRKIQKIEEHKKKKEEYSEKNKYDYQKLFKKVRTVEKNEEISIIKYKEKIFTKIINKIKRLLKR